MISQETLFEQNMNILSCSCDSRLELWHLVYVMQDGHSTTNILICIVYVVLYQFALLLVFSRGLGGWPWMLDLKTGPHHWRGGRSDGTSKSYNFNWIKTIYASFLRAHNKITFCKQFRMSLAVYADCCVSPGIRMPLLLSLRSTVFWFSESKSINCSLYSCKRRLTLTWPYIVIHFKSVKICSPKLQTVFYLELNLIRLYKFNRLFRTWNIEQINYLNLFRFSHFRLFSATLWLRKPFSNNVLHLISYLTNSPTKIIVIYTALIH